MAVRPRLHSYFSTSRAAGKQSVGERVIQELNLARVFDPISLQNTGIVAITQDPIPLTGHDTKLLLDMIPRVLLDPVVVEQRVVHIDEEADWAKNCLAEQRGYGASSPNV
jgi:hypothetical protein